MASPETSARFVKIEAADGNSTTLSSQAMFSPTSRIISLNSNSTIKRLVQTSDGRLIVLPNTAEHGIQQHMVSSVFHTPTVVVSSGINTSTSVVPPRLIFKTIPVTIKGESEEHTICSSEDVQDTSVSGLGVDDFVTSFSSPQITTVIKTDESSVSFGSDEESLQQSLANTSQLHAESIMHDTEIVSTSSTRGVPLMKQLKITPLTTIKGVGDGLRTQFVLTPEQLQLVQGMANAHSLASGTVVMAPTSVGAFVGGMRESEAESGYATIQINDGAVEDITTTYTAEDITTTYTADDPCPICADKVSGYHYGIFTCESCKGFFKRTVQNKKAFICHRKGDCDINVVQRKKCPACRFKRCLLAGMKLEAVREDRQRGGRSNYDGAQNYSRLRQSSASTSSPSSTSTPRSRPMVVKRSPSVGANQTSPNRKTIMMTPENGKLVKVVLDHGSQTTVTSNLEAGVLPHTPGVLEDLRAVESLMSEEEADQDCCRGKFMDGDDQLFVSLLHFADHCLYKIVRWARNLPHFASVSTDDQILLLQNCWGELLCMCCCWNSIRCDEELKVAHGRALNMEVAEMLGIANLVQKLLDFVAYLRELELDSHEFIALKAILLLNPDVKNLRDHTIIRAHQDRVTSALLVYSASHYPQLGNKVCQLLTCLPHLSRLCHMGKEILKTRQSQGDLPQYSLLSELLKGDSVVQT